MKVSLVTTATNPTVKGFKEFKRSLDKFKWDYHIIDDNYVAYGSKMKNAYEFAKKNDFTHLFILDAYDVLVLGTMEDCLDRIKDKDTILFNAEKACWPHGEWAKEYPEVESDWKYLNGGACFVKVDRFIKLFEENPIKDTDNDQEVLGRIYLDKRNDYKMALDTNCELFQSIAFEHEKDFLYGHDVFYNFKTDTFPLIIHGNGKTEMSHLYKLV